MPDRSKSVTVILFAIFSVQFSAAMAKYLFPIFGVLGVTLLRASIATLILLIIFPPRFRTMNATAWKAVIIYGLSLGGMNTLYYMALSRIPLGIAVTLEFIGPLALSIITSRRKLDFLWSFLAAIGIFFILPVTQHSSSFNWGGALLATGAGACWALYIFFGKHTGNSIQGGRAVSIGLLFATLFILPFGLSDSEKIVVNYHALPYALFLAIFSSALPYSLEMTALKKLPTKTFSILMSLEPMVAALSGFLILKEYLSITQILAMLCVVVASIGTTLTINPNNPPPAPLE